MIASWTVILSALVYLCFLFVVAQYGDRGGQRRRIGLRLWLAEIADSTIGASCPKKTTAKTGNRMKVATMIGDAVCVVAIPTMTGTTIAHVADASLSRRCNPPIF